MIESPFAAALPTPAGSATPASSRAPEGAFDDALKAAMKAAQRQEEHRQELQAIREKGFRNWVRDAEVAKLKEKLRQMVMADMGINDEDLDRMGAAVRQILEGKIEEEVERRLSETLGAKAEEPASTASQPAGNKEPGKKCPVIPGLVWPGGAAVL